MRGKVAVKTWINTGRKQKKIYLPRNKRINKNIHNTHNDGAYGIRGKVGMKMKKSAKCVAMENDFIKYESLIEKNRIILEWEIPKSENQRSK